MTTSTIIPPTEEKRLITGRDELNVCEWPLGALRYDKTSVEGDYTDTFADYIQGRNGQWIKREWTIKAYKDYGRPTPLTDDVFIALMEITKEVNNFQDRRVPVSKALVLEKMFCRNSEKDPRDLSGRCWDQLEDEMKKLVGIVIEARNAFYLKEQDSYAKFLMFGILDDFCFMDEKRGRKPGQMVMPFGWFTWNEILFRSLNSGFIKKLNTDLYYSLEYDISRRLFRMLDKFAYNVSYYKSDLLILCREKLGMSRNYQKANEYKRKLDRAHGELKERGIIEGFEYAKVFSSFWNEERWMVEYYFPKKKPKFTEQEVSALQMGVSEEEVVFARYNLTREHQALARWIIAQDPGRVAAEIAVEMVQKTPHCPEMVEVIVTDFEKKKKQGYKFTNPIGWLRKTLSDPHYRRPKGLKTQTEQKKEEEVKLQAERQRQAKERLEEEYTQYLNIEIAKYRESEPQRWQRIWQEELDTLMRNNSYVRDRVKADPKAVESHGVKSLIKNACKKVIKQALNLSSFEEWLKNR